MRPSPISLLLLAAGGAALCAVWLPRPSPPVLAVHERPGPAAWQTLAGRPPAFDALDLQQDRRPGLVLSGPGRWRLQVDLPRRGRLRFALQADLAPEERRLSWRTAEGQALAVRDLGAGAGWRDAEIDLSGSPAGPAALEVELTGSAPVWLSELRVLGPAADARPNVLVYVIDCLRADHVGAYGYQRPTTPALDALARDGALFEDVTACAGWTKPSTACLFTSLPPSLHGAQTVDDRLDESHTTLSESFARAGYSTLAWVDNPFVSSPAFGLTQGFDRVVQVAHHVRDSNINDLPADAVHLTRRVEVWLQRHPDERFFAYVHSLDLHASYRWRPGFSQRFARRGAATELDLYDGELAANDAQLGALVEVLRRRGQLDRTLLAVTADHGEEFGEHGTRRHGASLFQGLLHIPLVVRAPGGPRGLRLAEPVSNLDLAPTLLDLAGQARPASFQGLSLRPLLEGRALPPGRMLAAAQLGPRQIVYAARRGRLKAIRQLLPEPGRWLFDLRSDAGERHDLGDRAGAEGRALLSELDQQVQAGQSGWHVDVGPAPPGAKRLELRLQVQGRIVEAMRFALDLEDHLGRGADGSSLRYAFTAEGDARRHLVVRTAPEDAPLRVELWVDGRRVPDAQVRVGPSLAPASGAPLPAPAARVSVSQVPGLVASRAGLARVFHLPPQATASKAVLDPELERNLRALGYLQ